MLFGTYHFAFGVVILFFLVFYALMTVTYGIAVPSGLFVPSLAVGAAFGQVPLLRDAFTDFVIARDVFSSEQK